MKKEIKICIQFKIWSDGKETVISTPIYVGESISTCLEGIEQDFTSICKNLKTEALRLEDIP